MYYQVLIETINDKTKEPKEIYELDIPSKNSVLNETVLPYLLNKEFQFNGYFLDPKNIQRIIIKTTDKSARELSQYENDHMEPGLIMYVSPEDIIGYDNYTNDVTKEFFSEGKEKIDEGEIDISLPKDVSKVDKTKVFIVHGHDNLAKTEVARFIERLGFQPIILHEQASSGMTIIEKIESYSNVGFGIVLYTPCDVGSNKDGDKLLPRARQNVVFEHGFLMGKVGRNNVCALVKEDVETPNDISGVVYIPFDLHGAWHLAIAKELRNSGYKVDMNLVL
ncbi:DNA-binding protein [Cerasibacillus terrae]|uniref:DNA-binding protein n=1 Tax=Cerasibacillus terrae TaxID=2498845 RepID=A0A5C8NV27_9BACI|nr:nucleotide-binding protein [Cerasibacillus terrae]TXL65049.1 DNA-binding protein [Cerasibacillus terrae]